MKRDEVVHDLKRLGIRPGDHVMLHGSLSSLGWVEGGAEEVVEAFLEAMEPDGTLLTPAFTEGAWGEHLAMPDCRDCCPTEFCSSTWPSHEGAIPNAALKRAGHLRGCHPTHSWVANGARAAELLRNQRHSPTPCGHGNPFEKLAELDGCIVTLGVGVNTITLWHYFEDLLKVPYLGHFYPEERHLSYTATGLRIQYEFPGIMQDVVRASGIMNIDKVGRSTSGLIRARTFRQFMATIISNDPYCFLPRPPARDHGDLALDALQKAAAMLRAWSGPRCDRPAKIDWPEAESNDVVREDCRAFAGYHEAEGRRWPLCRANGRHPDLFHLGGVFNRYGQTTCGCCPWHLRFPAGAAVNRTIEHSRKNTDETGS